MINIYVEGEGAELDLWKHIKAEVFHNNTYIVLESYKGIKNLGSFVDSHYNSSDIFIISMDNVPDNNVIQNIVNEFKDYAAVRKNIYILDLLCFEDTLMSFKHLDSWLFTADMRKNDKKTVAKLNLWREYNVSRNLWRDNDYIIAYLKFRNIVSSQNQAEQIKQLKKLSTENVASILVKYITNTSEFSVDKGNLGKCFYCNCKCYSNCIYYTKNRFKTPINRRCGLWYNKKSTNMKINQIYRESILYSAMLDCKKYFRKLGDTRIDKALG